MSREVHLIRIHTQPSRGQVWLDQYMGQRPTFNCVLGFTATGLIPGISAAGLTPRDREYTAVADAEFLYRGHQPHPTYPLPPLHAGASPVLITRAIVDALNVPVQLFNAGLPHDPSIPTIDLQGEPAQCLSDGKALPLRTVYHLFRQGLRWGHQLGESSQESYQIISECVVGGTTTALAVLLGLGVPAIGKVNSSHPVCNHGQKLMIVQQGLQLAQLWGQPLIPSPLELVAAVGDPMQVVAAGLTISASQHCGVMLAGGTQMLAVYSLARAMCTQYGLPWHSQRIVVGTTRWVAEDSTGDTVGLATAIGDVPLLSTQLDFSESRHAALRAYEQGYVKEGVGAGAAAIAAVLYAGWTQPHLLAVVDQLADQLILKPT